MRDAAYRGIPSVPPAMKPTNATLSGAEMDTETDVALERAQRRLSKPRRHDPDLGLSQLTVEVAPYRTAA